MASLTTPRLSLPGSPIKTIVLDSTRGPGYIVFEVEYLCNGPVKKDGVNANLVSYDSPNFKSRAVTIRHERLGAGRLCAADKATGIL